jgi:predicted DNA-binding helix-hairpin-helix protein
MPAMFIQSVPDTFTKLTQMGDMTLYEPAGDTPHAERRQSRSPVPHLADCISHVATPQGSKPILKTMITTACERNCYYCPFRAGRGKMQRITFKPDELAGAFDTMQRAKQVDGLFLSSGIIKGSVTTQDKIIDTVDIVRRKYRYRGYVHLKIMPGIERDQLYRAMQLADRISVNLEAPTQERLNALAPKKDFDAELLTMLRWAEDIRQQHPYEKLARSVTQFVVGAVGDTDLELLSVSDKLYQQMSLQRAYFSAFHPISQTPLENVAATPAQREFRLYQASFLLRDYNWQLEDLPFVDEGNLRQDIDPKKAWADIHLSQAPIEIMTADRDQLLRIPGFGPQAADKIISARQQKRLTDLGQLRKLEIAAPEQAAPYILLNGSRPPQQKTLL